MRLRASRADSYHRVVNEGVGGLDRVEDEGSVREVFVQIWKREKRGEEFADGVGVAVEVVDDE